MARPQSVGHHQVCQFCQHGIAPDTDGGKRPVERGLPLRPGARRIGTRELHETFQRRKDGADRAAQIMRGGAVVLGIHGAESKSNFNAA